MPKEHVSAFALYQTMSSNSPPPAKKAALRVSSKKMQKKKKPDEGPVTSKVKSKERKKSKKININGLKEKEADITTDHKQVSEETLQVVLDDLESVNNSRERARKLFQWLINPVPAKDFFRDTWEKKPILIQRKNPDYYKGLFSTAEFDRILREDDVQYGVNLDVTSYTDGKRETHNPPGRALPFTVWDFYEGGCSLRLLNPQAFSSTVWNVLSILQEKFGSMAGANVYLTPPGTQGFAPHYDDIEAFVVQLEGKKHWRVYSPRSEEEVLPVNSSQNFNQLEIGNPILEVVLEAGDLLYFPRGFIHQGDCLPDSHSLHITISTYQKNSWGDLLHKLLPAALEVAMEEDVEYRKGLPLEYLTYMGVQNSDKDDPRRTTFLSKFESLVKKLTNYLPVDAAVDLKAKDFLHDCLPPKLNADEASSSVSGAPARWENGKVEHVGVDITSKTRVRLLRAGIARLGSEGEGVYLYYTAENSRVYHKTELKSFQLDSECLDAMEFLIHSYPQFVTVGSLPCENASSKILLAELLFEKGIIQME